MASLTIENYVKAIYQITASAGGEPASTGRLAAALNVSPGTVTSMLKTLSDTGLAKYTPYAGVELTEAGRTLALRVVRRHRLLELFLVRTLNLSWDEVHEEAEHMEHAVSDLLVDRIDAYLGFPDADPHGDPIPRADGSVAAIDGSGLDQWPIGVTFQMVRVLDQSSEFLRYLAEAGLSLGVTGEVTADHTAAGVLLIRTSAHEMTMAREAARKILVRHADAK